MPRCLLSLSMQRSEAVGLVVIDESDKETLLVHRISADDIYQRQEGQAGKRAGEEGLSGR